MSSGFIGSLSSDVKSNIRINSTGVRGTISADVDFLIKNGKSRPITFEIIVPVNIGFITVDWATSFTDNDSNTSKIDFVGWVNAGKLVTGTTNTSTITDPYYGGETFLITEILSDVYHKFSISFDLNNNTGALFNCQRLIAGFTYEINPASNIPKSKGYQFDIFASVTIGPEA